MTSTNTTSSNHSASLFRDWMLGRSTPIPRILVLDGGVSTALQEKTSFQYRELWSSSLLLNNGHNFIRQGHLEWLQAGANVISTVTYQLHYEAQYWPTDGKLTAKVMDQMWKDGLQLAHQAVQEQEQPRPVFVVASCGCYGAAMANGAEYTGDYGKATRADLERFYQCKFKSILQNEPATAVALETIPSLMECQAIQQVLQQQSLPACYVSLACRDAEHLNDGTPVKQALQVFTQVPATRLQAIGFNCCDSQYLPGLLDILVTHLACQNQPRGVVLYPNSGEIWQASTESWQSGSGCTQPHAMVKRLMECIRQIETTWQLLQPGKPYPAILVGGCCRTIPATIAALRQAVDQHLMNQQEDDKT